eukprot:6765689-Karenia_brevis.AAC.1
MFWNPNAADSIQKTFVLEESMRRMILEADRNGNQSWEMYCFVHGFPTRNVGSWLPGQSSCLFTHMHLVGPISSRLQHGSWWHLHVAAAQSL